MADTQQVKIQHASFWYTDGEGRQRVALRGDEVELNAEDYERGSKYEAFVDPDEQLEDPAAAVADADPAAPPAGGTGDTLDIDASIDKVLGYVGDDPARAAEALEAERAKGDEARSTLVAKLEGISGSSTA